MRDRTNDARLRRERNERIARVRERDMVRALAMDIPPALTFEQTGEIDDVAYYAEVNGAPDPTVEQVREATGIGVEVVASYLADPHYLNRDRWAQLREEVDNA
ncbi:hypothetical protein [Frigoribacterium sp. SL97]|uniref:hypothetical protein n=1 Tax=Frigoribacterium sp. SL97 TaxID=2994664 RepID=UPI0022716C5E|nr:hypothetical protein [Frigoribacterium sp. SL97]WAC53244.1 hypothetical protein OVA02_08455 [Frigoribacterium sp. SL97]